MSDSRQRRDRASLKEVRDYWNTHPLYTYELGAEPGTSAFFEEVDRLKTTDVERFSLQYWGFEQARGKRVLDIGCGPGWLSVQYARRGARVTAIDLTEAAVELTRTHLRMHGLPGEVLQSNAEELPFKDQSFDLVVSSGVLHHTPDTARAVGEACRVTRPHGMAKITLYRKGLLHSRAVFPAVRWLLKQWGVRHPGADLGVDSISADDFIRMYDGSGNPIGRGYTRTESRLLFARSGFHVLRQEVHFFPARLVPFHIVRSRFVHRVLDRCFGTMLYATLARSGGF